MNLKKILLFSMSVISVFVLLTFYDTEAGGKPFGLGGPDNPYEQNPPIATSTWVKKLKEKLPDGSTMQFVAEFNKGDIKGNSLTIYPDRERKVVLFDDGKNGGDSKAGDNIFSGYVIEDVDRFKSLCREMENTLREKGGFLKFTGHAGVLEREIPHLDAEAFDKFELVSFDVQLINAVNCSTDLLKECSLLITDINVVEDAVRTYNICDSSGNPFGAWTFGTLMKCMAFQSQTGVNARTLIKSFINNWMTNHSLNGQFIVNSHLQGDFATTLNAAVDLRENEMLVLVIRPWLRNATHNQTLAPTLTNWRTTWDATPQDSILKYAPFKLTAIVNRIDLRGAVGYSNTNSIFNAGETRFIYSLVNSSKGSPNCGLALQNNVNAGRQGFNVILEYGNPQTNCTALKNYAQQWLDLSDQTLYSLGDQNYNAALELITKQVTDSGAGGANKPNRSAINQVRSNEIALSQPFILRFRSAAGMPETILPSNRWQLEELHLNATTHLLALAPVVKTPRIHANGADGEVSNMTDFNTTTSTAFNFVDSIAKWVNVHQNQVKHGTINYPDLFPNSTKKILGINSEIISLVPGHTEHFWDGNNPFVPAFDTGLVVFPSIDIIDDQARQQFSVNTCAGCHGGEARTVFTQVRYLGYGQTANYWDPFNPDFSTLTGRKVDHVAPFLTGRKRTDAFFNDLSGSPSGLFSDQNTDAGETPNDDQLDGLFYTEDIAGRLDVNSNPILWSFNDLERRKIDLCQFLIASCNPFSDIFAVARIVQFQPFEPGSH